MYLIAFYLLLKVSIHAPVQGATHSKNPIATAATCFNPRSCARSDAMLFLITIRLTTFQSTLLCKERLDRSGQALRRILVSIHAPVQGATNVFDSILFAAQSFNPRSCARSDAFQKSDCDSRNVFQSTLLCKERLKGRGFSPALGMFQSTLLCKERHSSSGGIERR